MTLEERFWKKVDKSGDCWNWTGARNSGGYGSMGEGKAHRISYELNIGPIPSGRGHHGICVCHTCDNRACVNPAHLFLGDHADNMADAAAKGRFGDISRAKNPRAKLTPDDVENIRANAMNLTRQEIADMFGVSKSLVEKILSGKVWKNV